MPSNGCPLWWKVHRFACNFSKKVVSASTTVTRERESATKFHSPRAYYQIMTWMGPDDALNWGWHLQDNRFVPLMSTMIVAPDSLLEVIHCNCSTACKTLFCSYRKYGLSHATVCGPCQLQECETIHITHFSRGARGGG